VPLFQFCAWERLLDERLERVEALGLLHGAIGSRAGPQLELRAVTRAKLRLEMLRAAQAAQLPLHHDANAAAQCLGLLHGVCRQNKTAVARLGVDDIPPARIGRGAAVVQWQNTM